METFLNEEFASTFEEALDDRDNPENPRKLEQLFSGKFQYNGVSSSGLLADLGIRKAVEPVAAENLTLEQIVERGAESPESGAEASRPKLPPIQDVKFSDPLQVAPDTFRVNVTASVMGKSASDDAGGGEVKTEAFKVSGVVEMIIREEDGTPRITQFRPVDIVLQSDSDSIPDAGEISIGGVSAAPGQVLQAKRNEKLPIEITTSPARGTTVAVEFNFEPVGVPSRALKPGFREPTPEGAQAPRREEGSPPARVWQAPDKPGLYYIGVATVDKRPLNGKTYEENGISMTVYEGEPRRAVAIRYVTIPVQVVP